MANDHYVSFGQQVGAVAPPLALPLDDVTPEFRVALWNLVHQFFKGVNFPIPTFLFARARDKKQDAEQAARLGATQGISIIRKLIYEADWHELYDLILHLPRWTEHGLAGTWQSMATKFLETERSPYRFSGNTLVAITSEAELTSVGDAAAVAGKFAPAANHLRKALEKFSQRPVADYENSVKEAASSVESALTVATEEPDVGSATRKFATKFEVHPALMDSASKLFGYASDREGVRHGARGSGKPVDFDEAKLAIVSASAWLNYIAAKAS